jgi:hydroxylamine reductase
LAHKARSQDKTDVEIDQFIIQALFITVTKVNFDEDVVAQWVAKADKMLDKASSLSGIKRNGDVPTPVTWSAKGLDRAGLLNEAQNHSILKLHPNEDLQSLIQSLTYKKGSNLFLTLL